MPEPEYVGIGDLYASMDYGCHVISFVNGIPPHECPICNRPIEIATSWQTGGIVDFTPPSE